MLSSSNVLAYRSMIVGAKARHVTEQLDGGPPIAKVAFGSALGELNANLVDLMFCTCHIFLYSAVSILKDNCLAHAAAIALSIKNTICLVSPSCQPPNELWDKAFWEGHKL